jgi:hypothetical protein
MSKSWFYLSIISSLAIFTSSCGNESDNKAATPAATPSVSTSPITAPIAPSSTATTPATPNPAIPATAPPGAPVAAIKPISVDTTAGLIPPTDPENWSRTVAKGRPDPFAVLPLQPVVVAIVNPRGQAPAKVASIAKKSDSIEPIPTKTATVKPDADKPLARISIAAKIPKFPSLLGKQKISSNSIGTKNGSTEQPGYIPLSGVPRSGINRSLPKITVAISPTKSIDNRVPLSKKVAISPTKSIEAMPSPKSTNTDRVRLSKSSQTPISKQSAPNKVIPTPKIAANPAPVLDKPLQAMAIEISGMIDVAGKTQVIVKLPDESFSRYVEVGDRIANGKVLVKRVDGQNSLSPTVVLEEIGVEVSRKIGDKPAPAKPESAPKP